MNLYLIDKSLKYMTLFCINVTGTLVSKNDKK